LSLQRGPEAGPGQGRAPALFWRSPLGQERPGALPPRIHAVERAGAGGAGNPPHTRLSEHRRPAAGAPAQVAGTGVRATAARAVLAGLPAGASAARAGFHATAGGLARLALAAAGSLPGAAHRRPAPGTATPGLRGTAGALPGFAAPAGPG